MAFLLQCLAIQSGGLNKAIFLGLHQVSRHCGELQPPCLFSCSPWPSPTGGAVCCRSCNHSKPWPPSPSTEELNLVRCLGHDMLMPHKWLQLLGVSFQFQSPQPSWGRAGTLLLWEVNKLYCSPGALEVRLSSGCLDGSGCLPHLSLLSLFSWGL